MATTTASSGQFAIIIGNGEYEKLRSPKNYVNDAGSVDRVLKSEPFNFKTSLNLNCSRDRIIDSLEKSEADIQDASAIIFFYAGHGIILDELIYLVPITIRAEGSKHAVQRKCYELSLIVDDLIGLRKDDDVPIILILDFCRTEFTEFARGNQALWQGGWGNTGGAPNLALLCSITEGEAPMPDEIENEVSIIAEYFKNNLKIEHSLEDVHRGILKKLGKNKLAFLYSNLSSAFKFYKIPVASENKFGVPLANASFVPRKDIFEMIEAAPQSPDSCRIIVLSGLGGMGKTQIATEYCRLNYDIQKNYDYVFWVKADGMMQLHSSLRRLATNLLVANLGFNRRLFDPKDVDKEASKWVRDWLQKRTKWLIVLDNVKGEDASEVFEFLPTSGGDVIVTTRESIALDGATIIQVGKMNDEEAMSLLFPLNEADSQQSQSSFAQRIIEELDRMPLAISLARAYIENQRSVSIEGYVKKLEEKKKGLFPNFVKDSTDVHQQNVRVVLEISLEHIQNLDPLAVKILEGSSFLYPDSISIDFFLKHQSTLNLLQTPSPTAKDNAQIRKAFDTLASYSLLTAMNSQETIMAIHRLVQTGIYEKRNEDQRSLWARGLSASIRKEIGNNNTFTMETHLPHIVHIIEQLDLEEKPLGSEEIRDMLTFTIDFQVNNGRYLGTVGLGKALISVAEKLNDFKSSSASVIIESLNNLALFYDSLGKYTDAELLHQKLIKFKTEAFGQDNADTVDSLSRLAALYYNQKRYAEAESLYKQVLAIKQESTEKVDQQQGVARSTEKIEKDYQQQGLARIEKVEKDHPDLSIPVNNLGELYLWQGKYAEAEPLYQQALAINRKALGDSSDTSNYDPLPSLKGFISLYREKKKDA